jgi:hypothetical protein
MSDLHFMKPTGNSVSGAISTYIDRCVLLLYRAFQRDTDAQQAFRVWINDEFQQSKTPTVLLHDDPIYTVARYLGIPRLEIDPTVIRRAAKLAKDQHW